MADEMISRQRASTVRLVSQSAAAVLVAGAVFLVVFGSPLGGGVGVDEVAYDEVESRAAELAASRAQPVSEDAEPGALPPDMEAIEYSLQQIANAPKVPEPDNADDDEPVEDIPVGPEDNDGRTRFLGVIKVGERNLALLSAGGAQRIMGEGDTAVLPLVPGDQGDAPEVVVREVTSSYVRLAENGVERQVDKAPRVGIAVSQSTAPSADPPRSRGDGRAVASARREALGEEPEADRPINPDDFRREDGTIDYESLRAAARAKARARRDRFRGDADDEEERD